MGQRLLAAIFLLVFIPCAHAETNIKAETSLKKNTSASTEKIDKVLAGQQEILKQLDEIKNELYVIKIRATK